MPVLVSNVGYTHGGVFFIFKQAVKFCIPAGTRVTLSCSGRVVDWALKLQFLHVLQSNTTHRAASQHVKKARAPQLFRRRGEGLFHLKGFSFRNAVSAIEISSFVLLWFLVHGHWASKILLLRKRTKEVLSHFQPHPLCMITRDSLTHELTALFDTTSW